MYVYICEHVSCTVPHTGTSVLDLLVSTTMIKFVLSFTFTYIIRVFCQHPPTIDNLPSVYTVLPVPGYMWVPMYLYRLFLSDSNFFPFSWFFSFWIFDSVRKSWMYVMYVYIQYIHEASHTYMYTYINTSMYTCMYLYVCMCTCTYIYIHTFMCIDR